MKIWKRIMGLCLPFLLMMSCGGGGGGQVKISLTDSATDQYKAVYVTIDSVEVHASNASDESWVTLQNLNLPRTINLLDLMNGVREELGISDLPSGHYTQMRLILGTTPDDSINI